MRDIFTIPDKKLLSFVKSHRSFVKSYKCQDSTVVDNGAIAIIAVGAQYSDKNKEIIRKFLTCQRLTVNNQEPTVVNKGQMTNDESQMTKDK